MKKIILSILFVVCLSFQASALGPMMLLSGSGCLNVNDDFTGDDASAPNATRWTQAGATHMKIYSNKLNFNIADTITYTSSVTSKWTFPASTNFDVQVDFDVTILDAPESGNNYAAYLGITGGGLHSEIARYRSATINGYYSSGSGGPYNEEAQADASGQLRITQTGCPGACVVTTYMWDSVSERWEWFTDDPLGDVRDEDYTDEAITVKLLFSKMATSGSTTVDSNMDNFVVNSGCAK